MSELFEESPVEVEMVQGRVLAPHADVQTYPTITYGSLFLGAETIGDVWNDSKYVFRVERAVRVHKPPSSSPPAPTNRPRLYTEYALVPWKKVPTVDLLIVRQPKDWKLRTKWMAEWCKFRKVRTLVLIHHPSEVMGSDSRSLHAVSKELKALGYRVHTLSANADECGAATWSNYIITIATHKSSPEASHISSLPFKLNIGLPSRSCRNVVRDYNIPTYRYKKNIDKLEPESHPVYTNFLGVYCGQPVFSLDGPFSGNNHKAFVHVASKGYRTLEDDEWRSLKGISASDVTSLSVLAKSIEANIFSALGDVIFPLLQTQRLPTAALPEKASPPPRIVLPSNDPIVPEWNWSPPDLAIGSRFYNATVRNLNRAVATLPEADQGPAFSDGLKSLDSHRRNYGNDGPQRMAVLWWEWPPRHWADLRLGTSMNFMKVPPPGLVANQDLDPIQLRLAIDFVEELIGLGIVKRAASEGVVILNNLPLFLLPKPGQPNEYRCIADGKRGGQNDNCVPDPCMMTSPDHILPHLYRQGFSATVDMSKYFHTFRNRQDERQYLGLLFPGTDEACFYDHFAMGTCNSPGGSGRFGAALVRRMLEHCSLFKGVPVDNSKVGMILDKVYHPEWGEGRVLIGEDGLPVLRIWIHVDDIFIHGPMKDKVADGLSFLMDEMVRLGLICNHLKTNPPSQRVKFCGFVYDTTGIPTLEIPTDKVSRGVALVSFLLRGVKTSLARLTLSKVIGYLQSLVAATPSNVGASFLCSLNKDLHDLEDRNLQGTIQYYFTAVDLSPASHLELLWWDQALSQGLLRSQCQTTDMASLGVTWGDGSGTGTGGTFNWISMDSKSAIEPLETWMGVWTTRVHHFTSNWKELRTLLVTLERLSLGDKSVKGKVLWYMTDNQVTYDVCRRSKSFSLELLKLVQKIRILELSLGCRLEVIHVPGKLMIRQGTDGLSRGVLLQPLSACDGILPLQDLFRPADTSSDILRWALHMAQVPQPLSNQDWQILGDLDDWTLSNLIDRNTLWCVSPHFGKQCMLQALYAWVESPWNSAHLFVIPRVMQRDFGRVSKYILMIDQSWSPPLSFIPVLPFLVYYLPPFNRLTAFLSKRDALDNRLDEAPPPRAPAWVKRQVDDLQRL